jgi:hypothetical protein
VKAKAPARAEVKAKAPKQQHLNEAEVDQLIDRYKQRRKAKKDVKRAEQQAMKLIHSHYAPEEKMFKSFSDFL